MLFLVPGQPRQDATSWRGQGGLFKVGTHLTTPCSEKSGRLMPPRSSLALGALGRVKLPDTLLRMSPREMP